MVRWTTQAMSDVQLLERVRGGDTDPYGELWRRHSRSGFTVARGFTSSIDVDDLVAEAFASIYQCTIAGGGPTGAFRPYLYTTIRNLARTWGRSRRELAVDDLAEFADPASLDDPVVLELESSITATAFRALPERWQTVLWYTEVEGLDPHQVAPLLGLTANGVSALAYRAREGLRSSWLQAHVTDATASGPCRWTIERLGDRARRGLSKRERARVDEHLGVCGRCTTIAEEVDDVGARIAAIMVPLLVGGGIGGSVVAAQLAHPGAAVAASAASSAAGSIAAASAAPVVGVSAALAGSISAPASVMASLLVAAIVTGSAVAGVPSPPSSPSSATESTVSAPEDSARVTAEPSTRPGPGLVRDAAPPPVTPEVMPYALGGGGIVEHAVATPVNDAVSGARDFVAEVAAPNDAVLPALPLQPGPLPAHAAPSGPVGTDIRLDLGGTGMPGATVSAQAAGVVYGTAVVAPSGTWGLRTSVLPGGIAGLQLSQRLTLLGIAVPLDLPLTLLSDTLGVHIELLS